MADRLAELYEMVFPDHPEWLDEEVVNWKREEDIAPAIERFLQRVSVLFPVYNDIYDLDLEVLEWRLYEIPVMPMGFDIWIDCWNDLKEPAPYLLHMLYSRSQEAIRYNQDDFAELYPDYLVPDYLEPHRLIETLCHLNLSMPLDALPDLIEMLIQNSGNCWLDVSEQSLMESGGYPLWNREDVAWLAEEWQKAKPLLDRIQQLLDWQNNAPKEMGYKLTAVRQALLDAYQQSVDSATETIEKMEKVDDSTT